MTCDHKHDLSSIRDVLLRLIELLDKDDGWAYDTYDTRVGFLYQFLYRQRASSRTADFAVRGLYALEFLAPIAYRKFRRIPRTWDAMGNSYRANAHVALALVENREVHLASARRILDQVAERAVGEPSRRGFALGFPCITGSDKLWSTQVPVAHYSLRVARAFMRYQRTSGDDRYQPILAECMRFFVEGLPWVERDGLLGVAYTPEDPLQVINIWSDVASVLACFDRMQGSFRMADRAAGLTRSVLAHLREDGTWPYFARWESRPGDVDNSHTAMVLGALADLALCDVGGLRPRIITALESATPRWIELFFNEETGQAWNTVDQTDAAYAVTVGDTAYAILRLARAELGLTSELRARLLKLADRNLSWALRHLKLPDGRFSERRLGRWHFALGSVRSFDGLIADAMALHWALKQGAAREALWTV